ncbi:uncharacterized protein METZ01_LOCUS460893, partial [marine metagenome]
SWLIARMVTSNFLCSLLKKHQSTPCPSLRALCI